MKTLLKPIALLCLTLCLMMACSKSETDSVLPTGATPPATSAAPTAAAPATPPNSDVILMAKTDYERLPLLGVNQVAQAFGKPSLLKTTNPNLWLFLDVPPVVDQGGQKASLSWAAAQYEGYLLHVLRDQPYDNSANQAQRSGTYIHNQTGACDEGRSATTVMNFMKTKGVCGVVGYNTTNCSEKPGALADLNAAFEGQIQNYGRTDITASNVKALLSYGVPVLIVYPVTENFEAKVAKDGLYDKLEGKVISYRAAYVTAYSDTYGTFEVTNSKGAAWGNKGKFYLSYNTLPTMVTEAYVMTIKPN